jgi:uncharacterized protein
VHWTWDQDKAAANRLKHGLSFETAVLVFDDPLHASRPDPAIAGKPSDSSGRCCCWSFILGRKKSEEGEQVGRIISARKATAHERRAYEEGNF